MGTKYYLQNIYHLGTINRQFYLSDADLIKCNLGDKRIFEYYFPKGPVELIEEPNNPHDPNAIAVKIAGELVGYIAKEETMQVKTLLRNGHFASITSFISGGRYKTAISNKRVEVFENKITVTIYIHHK
ncbi:hypothetical protein SDC9_192525 [bioreactor metagenome]|uniref:HIRAN domain-containing protein n=1 Tax=bioreactor metagenome TaxID=1076179 RepID=A0A645I124_9ZZZZ